MCKLDQEFEADCVFKLSERREVWQAGDETAYLCRLI